MIPTSSAQILELHQKYSTSEFNLELVWGHCQAVLAVAQQLMAKTKLNVDPEIVRAGCLLHDIGVYPLISTDGTVKQGVPYLTHGIVGQKILNDEGLPEVFQQICAHHTGVGLSREDVINQKLPLPVADYTAQTEEELLIMYCDKFHSKTLPPQFNSFESYREHVSGFGADKGLKFDEMAAKFGKPELAGLSEKFGFPIH